MIASSFTKTYHSIFIIITSLLAIACSGDKVTPADPNAITISPASGIDGDLITIQGSGFPTTTSILMVKINGTYCTAVSSTPTEIIAVVPPGFTAGTVNVTYYVNGSSVSKNSTTSFGVDATKPKIKPGARSAAVSFVIGTKAYLGTGRESNAVLKKDFWEVDPVTNTWTQKADLPGAEREAAFGFAIGTKGYLGGGIGQVSTPDFYEFDPSANSWTAKASFGSNTIVFPVTFVINGLGYVVTGGDTEFSVSNTVLQYNPSTDAWTPKANFPGTARNTAACFVLNNKVYMGTGASSSLNALKDFWQYDPANDSWLQKADFGGTARNGATGFTLNGKGYIGLGGKRDVWSYNDGTNTWTQASDFSGGPRFFANIFPFADIVYLSGGHDNQYFYDDIKQYK